MRARMIDEIWEEISRRNLLDIEDISHLVLDRYSMKELIKDYLEEFDLDNVSLEELKSYMGMSIVVTDSLNGKKYKLLKEA